MILALQAAPQAAFAGTLNAQPNLVDFGLVSVISGTASNSLEITNNGSSTQVTGFSKGAGCAEFSVEADGLPATLGSGETLVVSVAYDPSDRISDNCLVTVQSSGTGGDFTLQGDGAASSLNTQATTLNFMPKPWNGGAVEVLYVPIQNDGEVSIGPSNLSLSLALGTHFVIGEVTGLPISTGEQALIAISFQPASVGVKADTLTIAVNNDSPSDPNDNVILNGTGTELPALVFKDSFEEVMGSE